MNALLRKRYIAALLSSLILCVAIVAFFRFYGSMKTRELRVLEARDRLASFEQYKRIFAEEAVQFDAIKARITALQQSIITENSIPELLSSLESMAKAENVDFSITLVESAGKEGTARLRIDFSASGSLARIEALVEKFLSQSYQVRFTRFSLYQSNAVSDQETATDKPKAPTTSGWELLGSMEVISY